MTDAKITIIGGGFSGLTLAYYLLRLGVKVEVFEKSDRLGGLISTLKFDWGFVETAANGLIGSPLVDELFRDLGIEYAEHPAHATRSRYIFRGHPRRWPLVGKENVKLASGLARILSRKYLPQVMTAGVADSERLTAREWVSRELGPAAFDYLIGPAVQGIMATDDIAADTLIGYVRGAFANRKNVGNQRVKTKVRRGTVSPKHGMGELIAALVSRIENLGGAIHLNSTRQLQTNGITVLAVPAHVAAKMLSVQLPELSRELAKIDYLSLTTVTADFARSEGEKITSGFGCLFPPSENFAALGVLFSSAIFAREQPADESHSIETWLVRPSPDEHQEAIIRKIVNDRSRLLGFKSGEPKNFKVTRWPQALPHYNLKSNDALKNIRSLGEPALGKTGERVYLTGNYLGQIGLGRILARNHSLAGQIASELPNE